MFDFLKVNHKANKKQNRIEVFPSFLIRSKSNDLMVRGRDFYAIWDEENKLWSMDEQTAIDLIDVEVLKEVERLSAIYSKTDDDPEVYGMYMGEADSGMIDKWHKYVQKQCRDNYHQLDEKVIFSNSKISKRDYASKKLEYALEAGDISAWEELVNVLYAPEERDKLEWAIGAVVSGDSKKIQKCIYLYGGPKTGKSTILELIGKMFDGYTCTFDAKQLGSSSASFSLEPFKDNPLVGIQTDSSLGKIDDNTRLNTLISHERLMVNAKYERQYSVKFNTFLFMAANDMAKITSSNSGLTRRIIDVYPTGKTIPYSKYIKLMDWIKAEELGHVAQHCLDRYNELGINYYSNYTPQKMIAGTNEFFNYIQDMAPEFIMSDQVTLKYAWSEYKKWCEEFGIKRPLGYLAVREELMNYFDVFEENSFVGGKHARSVYSKFHRDKFVSDANKEELVAIPNEMPKHWLELKDHSDFEKNVFDETFADCFAQYGDGGSLKHKWVNVKTKLKDLDTTKTHHVRVPETYIHVDFDKKDKDGNKSLELNLEEAKDWPPTYAEVSKGGQGLHLTYLYSGDSSKLANIVDEDIEIKVCNGYASLRRRLSLCNDLPIATISSGLPLKGGKKMVNLEAIKNEKVLRRFILNCLLKKHHDATAPEVDYIYSELEKVYASGLKYDVSDLRDDVYLFASSSSHQSQKCLRLVTQMHFKSDEPSEPDGYPKLEDGEDPPIVFFDVEIFPNLFVLCYKFDGEKAVGMVNPSGDDISKLLKYRLVGFNNRKYDNHILYARLHDYNNQQLYALSQKIINDKVGFFGEAYNLSYTDIYDFASSGNKMSLKKWEIELGIHHQELGLPWDQPVPEELWDKVVEYCLNDVEATEAAFHCDLLHADFVAREILADIAGMTANDTTNQLTTRIIFGDAKNPQNEFVYTDLSTLFPGYEFDNSTPHEIPNLNPEKPPTVYYGIDRNRYTERALDKGIKVLSDDGSMKMVKIVNGKSIYRGCDPSEGGRVYAEPGVYTNVALLDIASMHPSSIENLNLFGPYTKNFSDLKLARLYIKHKEFDKAKKLFGGKLAKYLDDPDMAKSLSNALKTAINSVYGLTSANFDNKFRDPRNVDNIVAKRGALFMIELQLTLQEKGYQVAHVKTDSIKIPDAGPKVIDFVTKFGKKYGYEFEHEATYEKMCLVNESTYVAKDKADGHWTATGAQFQVPYVFKTLFSHEPIEFEDMCETKSVTTALYLDFNEALGEDEHNYTFVGKVGLFCPMQEGAGGGVLLREKDGKYSAATGTKGYRWMEAEMVRNLGLEHKIDRSYYDRLVDEAKAAIGKFVDVEKFVSDDPVPELPFD